MRRRLLAAHTAARAASGWEPAEWALDRDLEDALDLMLADHADPPDAVALVGERHRRVRRRSVVLGTGATLAAGAVAAWFVDAVVTGTASQAAPPPPRPGDPVWMSSSSWPARGRLARDAGVAALVAGASPRAHLLWADDLAGQRVVVAATADPSGSRGTLVRMWAGPRGAAADTLLAAVGLVRDRVTLIEDVVPVAVEAGARTTRTARARCSCWRGPRWSRRRTRRSWPTGATAGSAVSGPTSPCATASPRSRSADRCHRPSGCGSTATTAHPLGATPLGLPAADLSAPLAETLLEALGPFVAACTGLPVSAVRSSIALEMDVRRCRSRAGRGRVSASAAVASWSPSRPCRAGPLLRTVRVAGDGRGQVGPLDVETTRVVDAADGLRPVRDPPAGRSATA